MADDRTLRICEYNVENLFISMEYYQGEDLDRLTEEGWRSLALAQLRRKQKPLVKVQGVAKAILDIDADVIMMVEVGGRDSLENLNRYFLGDRYRPFFIEGNSRRAIDLAFLVRRGLEDRYRAEAVSNRDTPVEVSTMGGKYVARFSRDLAELRLYPDGSPPDADPALVLLLVHLKSKLSTEQDAGGKDLRTAEAIALTGFYADLRARKPALPIVVGGDFNAELASLELELLRRTDLVDFHDVLGTPAERRVSLVHFGGGGPHALVLDYLLVSPQLREAIVPHGSFTYRYKGFYELPEELPAMPKQRYQMASDHYPVVLTLRL